MMKQCTRCKCLKTPPMFNKDLSKKDGRTAVCKACRIERYNADRETINERRRHAYIQNPEKYIKQAREWALKNPDGIRKHRVKMSYGISSELYRGLRSKQQDKCAICQTKETSRTRAGGTKVLAVDHDHDTKEVRGLLCSKCNIGLGCFTDSIDKLENAIKYLKKGA